MPRGERTRKQLIEEIEDLAARIAYLETENETLRLHKVGLLDQRRHDEIEKKVYARELGQMAIRLHEALVTYERHLEPCNSGNGGINRVQSLRVPDQMKKSETV